MKINTFKLTAATALLSTTILGVPLMGGAHVNGDGRDGGHKEGNSSQQIMDRKQERKEQRLGTNHRNYDNWDKKEDLKFNDKNTSNKMLDKVKNNSGEGKDKEANTQKKGDTKIQNKPEKVKYKPKVPLVTYTEADAYGKDTILPLIAGLETAKANLDWETLAKNYHLLSNELKKGTKVFYKVDGKANRNKLIATYKAPAQENRAELALPLSIYMGVENIEAELETENIGEAALKLRKLKMLIEKLGNTENNALLTDLVAKVNTLESKINTKNSMSYYKPVSL